VPCWEQINPASGTAALDADHLSPTVAYGAL